MKLIFSLLYLISKKMFSFPHITNIIFGTVLWFGSKFSTLVCILPCSHLNSGSPRIEVDRAHVATAMDSTGQGSRRRSKGQCCSPHSSRCYRRFTHKTPLLASCSLAVPTSISQVYSLEANLLKKKHFRMLVQANIIWNHKEVLASVSLKKIVVSQDWGYRGQRCIRKSRDQAPDETRLA